MHSGITIFCFAASYAVTLLLETSRLLFRSGVRGALMVGFAVAGIVAHSWYLGVRASAASGEGQAALATAYDWYLVAAWVLAVVYLVLTYYYPRAGMGLFVMPLVLALVVAANYADRSPLSRSGMSKIWATIHGVALLLGTIAVMIGFVAGAMYLLHSWRLKRKLPPTGRFRFPSLERLQQVNGSAIMVSAAMLAAGFLSGTILNVVTRHLPWSDPVVWSTTLMFVWQLAAAVFNICYKAARQGRKVAYLTIASLLFLMIALAAYLVGHGEASADSPASRRGVAPRLASSEWHPESQA